MNAKPSYLRNFLKEESEDLSSGMLPSSLLVVHDTVRSSEHKMAELTRGQQVGSELLNVAEADVESGGDYSTLVETTDQVDNDLAGAVVIDNLEVADVTVLLHDLQEPDDNL